MSAPHECTTVHPRFRRRHPFRGALIALGLFIASGFVVRHVTTSHGAVSATPAGPSAGGGLATGRQAPPGTIGSRFDLQDGNGSGVAVSEVRWSALSGVGAMVEGDVRS